MLLFASDVHLSARRPERAQAFIDFLRGPCQRASRLLLLGDVFDEWLGDDDDRSPHPETLAALRDLTDAGVRVDFCFGNHDFLTGAAFYTRTGCQPLEDSSVVEFDGVRIAVLHGDVLCTRDEDYQRWRATFTNPALQQEFLAQPFAARVERAAALRLGSAQATALKAEDIMDVTPEAVNALRERLDADHVVHGHTHRPGVFDIEGGPPGARRIVLGDWYAEEQVLRWDAQGPQLAPIASLF